MTVRLGTDRFRHVPREMGRRSAEPAVDPRQARRAPNTECTNAGGKKPAPGALRALFPIPYVDHRGLGQTGRRCVRATTDSPLIGGYV